HARAADPRLLRGRQRERAARESARLLRDPAAAVLDEDGDPGFEAGVEVEPALGELEQREERLAVEQDRPARDRRRRRVRGGRGGQIEGGVACPDAVGGAEAETRELRTVVAERRPQRRAELREAVGDPLG